MLPVYKNKKNPVNLALERPAEVRGCMANLEHGAGNAGSGKTLPLPFKLPVHVEVSKSIG
jgi:hypothetical protein